MPHSLGSALAGLSKPGKPTVKTGVKKGTASMTIEPMPKTSFTDKNLEPKDAPPKPFSTSTQNAKPGAKIAPEMNMPNLPGLKRNPTGTIKT